MPDEEVSATTFGPVEWRRFVLVGAGYPPDDAFELADRPDIDLHVASYLLEAGCPLATALLILR